MDMADAAEKKTYNKNDPPCPACRGTRSPVLRSDPTEYGLRRNRRCEACGHKFHTIEFAEVDPAAMPLPLIARLLDYVAETLKARAAGEAGDGTGIRRRRRGRTRESTGA